MRPRRNWPLSRRSGRGHFYPAPERTFLLRDRAVTGAAIAASLFGGPPPRPVPAARWRPRHSPGSIPRHPARLATPSVPVEALQACVERPPLGAGPALAITFAVESRVR